MSVESQQQDVQGEEQSQSVGFVTTAMRSHFINLPPEIQILILCNYTVDQLISFRRGCKQFNAFFLFHQSTIVREELENFAYRTAVKIYYGLVLPRQLKFSNLVDMTRRCSTARDIAQLLTQDRLVESGYLQYDSPDAQKRAVYPAARVARNAYPYVLALLQFFEEYRFRLARNVLDPNGDLRPNDQLEGLLLAKYDHQTRVRLCAMYQVLRKLLYRWVPHHEREYLEFFILGGLEAFKKIICTCGWRFVSIIEHYSRAMPIQFPVTDHGRSFIFPRPRSVLISFDDATSAPATMIRRPIPKATEMLDLNRLHKDPDIELAAFLQWLMTYDGDEPALLRREED